MSFVIDTDKVKSWLAKWGGAFDGFIKQDEDSIKTLVFMALLERQNNESSYQDIADELIHQGVIKGEIDDLTPLRNSMFQIVKALERHKVHKLEKKRRGKESIYILKRRGQPSGQSHAASKGKIVSVLDSDLAPSRKYVAERLMKDRRMPFYGIYLPMRAASRWVLYSEEEAKTRSKYEGEECERLLKEWLGGHRDESISIIGLGVGEGIGEIEIIERLLSEDYSFKTIHYCAIDTNVHLLVDHVERLNDKFKEKIEERRLVCGVICGNFLNDFSDLIQTLRAEFINRGQFDDSQPGFIPKSSGVLISILGNVLGNLEQKAAEWKYFEPILESLKGHDLAFLLGVSVEQTESKNGEAQVIAESYPRDLDELLLATPRYLTHERGLLHSHQPSDSKKKPEFFLPEDDAEKKERCPEVAREDYQGDGIVREEHVKGGIYEFFYTTQWDLTMNVSEEEKLFVPAGTNLLLYNIIKFDINALRNFLISKGLEKASDHKIRPYEISSGNEKRVYAILALTKDSLMNGTSGKS